jgi:uncharacterized protein YceH (UPF0502 family)
MAFDKILDPVQARVLGCLIEKELGTPEYYPLSLNALTNACNQKSNRDPIMALSEGDAQNAVDALIRLHLVSARSSSGSRVPKFAHRLSNPVTQSGDLSRHERAVLCELLVRGPQTAGELRARAGRLVEFDDVAQVESTLRQLVERSDGPYAIELPRQPGRRETRYAHLYCGAPAPGAEVDEVSPTAATDRVSMLARDVEALRAEVAELRRQLEQLRSGGA